LRACVAAEQGDQFSEEALEFAADAGDPGVVVAGE